MVARTIGLPRLADALIAAEIAAHVRARRQSDEGGQLSSVFEPAVKDLRGEHRRKLGADAAQLGQRVDLARGLADNRLNVEHRLARGFDLLDLPLEPVRGDPSRGGAWPTGVVAALRPGAFAEPRAALGPRPSAASNGGSPGSQERRGCG